MLKGTLKDTEYKIRFMLKNLTRRSNWVIGHKLIQGAFPSRKDIERLRKGGVTTFVDLVTDDEYKKGKRYWEYHSILPEGSYFRFPIQQNAVQEDRRTLQFTLKLCDFIREGKVVYVHCAHGHGRSGVICAIVAGILLNLTPQEALDFISEKHAKRKVDPDVKTPNNILQYVQVTRILESILS